MGTRAPAWAFETRYPLFARLALPVAWILGVLVALVAIQRAVSEGYLGEDAHAYWLAAQAGPSYTRAPGDVDAYLYSPAFALLITPIAWLPWLGFLAVWIAVLAAALVWLLLRVRLRWAVPMFLLCVPELAVGNVFLLIAVCLALGLRHPSVWAFPILTKVTTGVGLLWFVVRGQWRALAIAIGTTTVVVVVGALIDPGAWLDWLHYLASNSGSSQDGRIGIAIRVVVAGALTWWAARTGRAWVIAVAVLLATPVSNVMALTILAAIPRLADQRAEPLPRSGQAGQQTVAH